jgi:glycogen(starch) synthase
MLFSIIINTYNRANVLEKTLASLAQLRWHRFEIIVISGPSEDGTLALLEKWQDRIKHAVCPYANLSISRNQGLALASGDWLVFIDDDAMPEPDWLCRLAAYAHNPQIGAMGGFVIDHTGRDYQAQYLVSDQFGVTQNHQQWLGTLLAHEKNPRYYPSLMGVNTCFRREALQMIGGFDQAYAYYLEETDIVLRLIKAGWLVKTVPDALVHHKFANSHIRHEKIVTSLYHILRSRAYFASRHGLHTQGLAAMARQTYAWFEELRDHQHANQATKTGIKPETLQAELQTGLHDGLSLAQSAADIPRLPQNCPDAKPFVAQRVATQRLRLCLVTANYPPQAMGGVARVMQTLAQALVQQGHEVTIMTQADDHYNADNKETVDWEAGVWVHRLQPLTEAQLAKLDRPKALPALPAHVDAFAAAVWQEVYRTQPQRQYHAVLGTIWDLDTAWLIANKSLPVWLYLVTSYHQLQAHKPEWQQEPLNSELLQPMLQAERWALQQAHCLASTPTIAKDTAELTQLEHVKHSPVIPFGLPRLTGFGFGYVQPAVVNNSLPERLVLSEAEVSRRDTLLYVGRFEHRKGIDVLLKILPDLLANYANLQVQLIGDDQLIWSDGTTLRAQFEQSYPDLLERIEFLGDVDEDRLQNAYQQCSLFVAPSRYESFGLIYLEAMRAAKPCIGTAVGGIPAIVQHNETGLLVPPDNPAELQDAIEQLLMDESLRQQMGEKGRKRFLAEFSDQVFAERIVQQLALSLPHSSIISPTAMLVA